MQQRCMMMLLGPTDDGNEAQLFPKDKLISSRFYGVRVLTGLR